MKHIMKSEAEGVESALRAGADPNSEMHTPLHYAAAIGDPHILRLMLAYGGNPEMEDPNGYTPLMFAASNNTTASCDILLQNHPDLRLETKRQNALCCTVKDSYREETMQRLLDAGAQPHEPIPHDAQYITPFAIANQRQLGHALDLMNLYSKLQLPSIDQITHDEVAKPHAPLLQHPKGWQQFAAICEKLESLGTPLTKGDLTQEFGDAQKSFLSRAAECYRLPDAISYLNKRGEQLTADDLLKEDGSPNTLLSTCIERQAVKQLFTQQNWKGQNPHELERLWKAMPPEGREQVGNYQQLRFRLREATRSAEQQEMGRD